jgi:hypothetical protein
MAYKIVSVGWSFCEDDVDELNITEHSAVAQYDIIIFRPRFYDFHHDESFSSGERYMSVNRARTILGLFDHWRTELDYALKAGKTVIVQMVPPEEFTIDTGGRSYPRAKHTTIHTETVSTLYRPPQVE